MNWLSKHRYKILVVLAATVVVLGLFGGTMLRQAWLFSITPTGDFEEYAEPEKPDYADPGSWAALPKRKDNADMSPARAMFDNQDLADADVFFVHPTTYLSRSAWNQPLDDEAANSLVDDRVMPGQAAVFNTCCRVYAPRYRQATLASFFPDQRTNGEKALALAYADVKRAFDHFISNFSEDRPFILAGHSQGARHLQKLLEDVVSGSRLKKRLVAAYTIGQPLKPAGALSICNSPDQTGCQLSWNSQTEDAILSIGREGSICVNPLSWTTTEIYIAHDKNLGSVDFGADGEIEEGVADAQCSKGKLLLTEVKSDNFATMPFGPGNYHLYEFGLYHMNIRENAKARVEAFLKD